MRAIRKHIGDFSAIVGLVAVALVVGVYILAQQRFQFPLFSAKTFDINAQLMNAQAVTPGQGQSVQVSGVRIGRIGDVHLVDGRAVAKLEIDDKYKDLLHTDATALLRPRTGLKDMFIQVDPGSHGAPAIKRGFTIPVRNTLTDIDLDEILAELDTDTRDYLKLLVSGLGRGLRGRGGELADVFRRFGPTFRDLTRVNRSVAKEHSSLRDLVHAMAQVNHELAGRSEDLAGLVDASAATFRAFASEDTNLSRTVSDLPGTLRQATRTLSAVQGFADELGPTAQRLIPPFRALDIANRAVRPFAREAAPILRTKVRPFVREARPLVRDLRPAADDLAAATPNLDQSFVVLNHLFNELSLNPKGREGPDVAARQEGYLFWLAWLQHDTINLFNIDDANGPMRPIFLTGTCTTLTSLVNDMPMLEFAMNLSPLLATLCGNPAGPTNANAKAKAG